MQTDLRVTVTEEDQATAKRGEAYCPLSAACARQFPQLADPHNIGFETVSIGGKLYRIPENLQVDVIEPWDHDSDFPLDLPVSGILKVYR